MAKKKGFGIIVLVLLVIGLFWFVNQKQEEKKEAGNYETFPNLDYCSNTRSAWINEGYCIGNCILVDSNIALCISTIENRDTAFMVGKYSFYFNTLVCDNNDRYWNCLYGTSWCYQESSNIATSCGGLGTGTYFANDLFLPNSPSINAYDTNWGSASSAYANKIGILYINYSKPISSTSNSLWENKLMVGGPMITSFKHNISIPLNCWNYLNNKIVLRLVSNRSNYGRGRNAGCYDGNSWNVLYIDPIYDALYEEGMHWNIASSSCNTPADIAPCNNCVSTSELISFINKWSSNDASATTTILISVINAWVSGTC